MERKPRGRKRAPSAEQLRDMARTKVPEALEAVCRVLSEDDVKPTERLRAAEIIMDRAYGKSAGKEDAGDVTVVMEGFETDWAE